MSGYQYCSAMVVEKDSFLRDALVDAINALGFRFVLKADGLPDAVEKLIQVRVNPDKVGTGGLDLLVTQASDRYAEGKGLIRWVRAHKDSPDPFMPILAIGPSKPGANNIISMGVGETAALPPGFSAEDFAAGVFKSTADQRHFVKVGKYFGPDRRLTEEEIPDERRESDLPYNKAGVRFFPPPSNRLERIGKDFRIGPDHVGAVKTAIEMHTPDFRKWVEKRSRQIISAPLSDCDQRPEHCKAVVSKLGEISAETEIKAAIFGFPLITAIAASLRELTEVEPVFTRVYIDLISKHGTAMLAALHDDQRSRTSEFATEIMAELRAIVQKYYKAHPELLKSTATTPSPPGSR
ncbi:hypothetical protein EOI86_22445 [Hwanghaeella grinnelliae]|uniref:Uncharacterized protein n=1 Tax=Hwanghaeella grinnelliae TaxID=2500179 RepID=A0A437QHI1_9PROT|nr:hypothetical protein [Hwanghaeella grinnelliae]RVU33894.1 hypothetical protein EOI86_22445 [Hwanghaeella grinnelliae]